MRRLLGKECGCRFQPAKHPSAHTPTFATKNMTNIQSSSPEPVAALSRWTAEPQYIVDASVLTLWESIRSSEVTQTTLVSGDHTPTFCEVLRSRLRRYYISFLSFSGTIKILSVGDQLANQQNAMTKPDYSGYRRYNLNILHHSNTTALSHAPVPVLAVTECLYYTVTVHLKG